MKIEYIKIMLSFLLIIFTSSHIFANNQFFIKKNARIDSYNDYTDRLDAQEREIQSLLGRIEIIEHNISKFERRLNEQKIQATNNTTTKSSSTTNDVFDVFFVQETDKKPKTNVSKATPEDIFGDKQFYDLALVYLKNNQLAEAEEKFTAFFKNYPNSLLLSNAYFWYGEIFFRQNMFDRAAISYLKGYKKAPKGVKAADSLLKLSLSLGKLNKYQEACSILDKLEEEFPNRSSISIKNTKDAKIKFGCKFNR